MSITILTQDEINEGSVRGLSIKFAQHIVCQPHSVDICCKLCRHFRIHERVLQPLERYLCMHHLAQKFLSEVQDTE